MVHDGHLHRAGICLRAAAAGFAETEVSIDHPGGLGDGPPLRDGGPANGDFSTESDTNGILAAPARRERPHRSNRARP